MTRSLSKRCLSLKNTLSNEDVTFKSMKCCDEDKGNKTFSLARLRKI